MSNLDAIYKSKEFLIQLQAEFVDYICIDDNAISHLIKLSSLKNGDNYVLKLLNPKYSDGYWNKAFSREISVLSKVTNLDYIIDIIDYGELILPPSLYKVKYVAMEYLDYSLNDLIYFERVSVITYLEIFKKLLTTVCELKNKGFYHRDIKPSNIMISKSSDSFSPKFIDFGCSYENGAKRILSIETAKENYSLPLSDRQYAAIELFCGFNKYPQYFLKAELFSLGAVLFECLTQKRFTNLYYNTARVEDMSELFFRLKDENKRMDNYLKVINYIDNDWSKPSLQDYVIDTIDAEVLYDLQHLINNLTELNFIKRDRDIYKLIFKVDLILKKLKRGCLS